MKARVFVDGFFDDKAADNISEIARAGVIAYYCALREEIDVQKDMVDDELSAGNLVEAKDLLNNVIGYTEMAAQIKKEYQLLDSEIYNFLKRMGYNVSKEPLQAAPDRGN